MSSWDQHVELLLPSSTVSSWTHGAGQSNWNRKANVVFSEPAPAPRLNVWQERQSFYSGAMPTDEIEEEAMLAAALRMSQLEAEQNQLSQDM